MNRFITIIFFMFLISPALMHIYAQTDADRLRDLESQIDILMDEIEAVRADSKQKSTGQASFLSRTTIGGYGEIHYNDTIGTDKSFFDIHRFVLYLGHQFSDRVSLHTETELEHAYIEGGDGGELAIEQLYLEVTLKQNFGFKVGRLLIPVGIVNPLHEPTTFNGVERPNVDKYIIPSTWYGDGAGIYGSLNESWSYELNLTAGLDGSGFSDMSGIRGGRQKERPGFNDPSLSGRIGYTHLGETPAGFATQLEIGMSFFTGGVNNANKGAVPDADTTVSLVALDARYAVGRFDLRAQYATVQIDDPEVLGDTIAEGMDGWYLETAWHAFRSAADSTRLTKDLVLFVRYEQYDTQADMPDGIVGNPAADRDELTFGISWFPASNVVFKADYQVLDDETAGGRNNQLNLGVGWRF